MSTLKWRDRNADLNADLNVSFESPLSWCQPEGVAGAGVEQTTDITVTFSMVTG